MFEIIKNASSIVGLILSSLTLLGIIIKPIRKAIIKWIVNIVGGSDVLKEVKEIKTSLDSMNEKMDTVEERLDKLDQRVLENERDRIKSELAVYTSKCARKMKIYPEEMSHINDIYYKYHEILRCNSLGTSMYNEIVKYYENQDWLKC